MAIIPPLPSEWKSVCLSDLMMSVNVIMNINKCTIFCGHNCMTEHIPEPPIIVKIPLKTKLSEN